MTEEEKSAELYPPLSPEGRRRSQALLHALVEKARAKRAQEASIAEQQREIERLRSELAETNAALELAVEHGLQLEIELERAKRGAS